MATRTFTTIPAPAPTEQKNVSTLSTIQLIMIVQSINKHSIKIDPSQEVWRQVHRYYDSW
jgi:hypothetical protein